MAAKPNKQMRNRIIAIMIICLIMITAVSGASLTNIMVIKGDEYQSKASEQQLYDSIVSAPRGDIYDCNMKTLAKSSTAWTVYLTPNGINKQKDAEKAEKIRETLSKGLSPILELDESEIYEKSKEKTYYVILKKRVDKETSDKVRMFITENAKLEMASYVGLDETTKRYYPNKTLASTVLGFVGDDNQGLSGLESYYDNELTGIAGRVVAAKNAKGTNMPLTYQKVEDAQKGNSLVTTIDSYIQYVAEKYIDEAVEIENVKERATAVVMNVKTGAILAMAVSNDFDPNNPFTLSAADQESLNAVTDEEERSKLKTELLNRMWRNKAVSDTYEPGSVFKIFTASTALEENLISEKSTFTCNHTYVVAGNPYHCHKAAGHGTQTLAKAIANSCNPAFIQIGQLIGVNNFSKYFSAFGLTEKTGIDLPGEASPYYHKKEDMGATELASSSFGQTFNITPLHTLSIAAAAVNGGYLVQPHVVSKLVDGDGKVVKNLTPAYKRQVLSSSTSEIMRRLLENVINEGAKNGKVAGYRVGGKTGTSEKISKMLQLNVKGLYIGSYIGIAPIDAPEIAVFVMLDEAMGGRYYGGMIAAPVGAKIMADILPYLGYEPQYSEEELKNLAIGVPDIVGLDEADAKSKISEASLTYKIVGSGKNVVKQLPVAGTEVYRGGTVIIYTEDIPEQQTTVPNLVGLTASEVNETAAAAGINIEFSGNITSPALRSYAQNVAAGETVAVGKVVRVDFREETDADLAQSD